MEVFKLTITLTQKERMLLEDLKSSEEICVVKYTNYANLAQDQQLKSLFANHAKLEQEHLNTVNSLLSGQVPPMSQQNNVQQPTMDGNAQLSINDKELCTDMLMTEKYVSGTYDTAIFEFKDKQVRDVLNHIQKEEQQHGEAIFKYMESKGLYNPQ